MYIYIVEQDKREKEHICEVVAHMHPKVKWYDRGKPFLEDCENLPRGLIILDTCLPDLDGMALLHKLKSDCDNGHEIILLSGPCSISDAVHAMKEGAINFFEKPFRQAEMVDAVKEARDKLTRAPSTELAEQDLMSLAQLTPRELSVLKASSNGRSAKSVAHSLGLSVRTIEMHRSNIIKKLDAKNFAGALVLAAKAL